MTYIKLRESSDAFTWLEPLEVKVLTIYLVTERVSLHRDGRYTYP